MSKRLHSFIAYFEKEVEEEIRLLQKELFELTGAKASLKEWRPHITIGKALNLDDTTSMQISNELKSFVKSQEKFQVELKDFGFMDDWKGSKLFSCEPYVLYIKVVLNSSLISFVDRLDSILKKYDFSYDIFPYNPHLTLAFKDLDKVGFEKAKELLEKRIFSKIININGFSITTDKNKKDEFIEVGSFKFN